MNNQKKIGLFAGIIFIMILMVWLFSSGGDNATKGNRHTFISSNWTKRFQPFDKNPMGLYLFNTLVSAHIDSTQDIYVVTSKYELDSLMLSDTLPKTYMFVGNSFGLENSEIDSIVADVEDGSRLFLSYNGLTDNIYDQFFRKYEERFDYAESINVFADKKKHYMINLFQKDTIATVWKAFGDLKAYDNYKPLSSFMEMDNFIKMERGDGYVYLHTTPGLYYNYQIKRTDGYKYAAYTIDQLPKDQDVILLELGRLSDNFGNEDVDLQEGDGGKEDDSYLRLIFENPTLLTAMLLGIFGLILFIMFRSKRTHPVVPFIDKRKDMTLAFAETITSIYFAKRNPYGLLQVQRKNFYATIQKHFFIDLSRREGEREIEILAEKSNKSKAEIIELIQILETKEASTVTEQTVTEISQKKRKFYVETGIISEKIQDRVSDSKMEFKRSLLLPSLMVMGGIFLILFGFYYLMQSIGVGIILWPIGLASVTLGVIRVSKPAIIFEKNEFTYRSPFGKKKVFDRDDLIRTEVKDKGVILHFTENRKLIINNWDLSRFDRKQFERLILKLHKQEL